MEERKAWADWAVAANGIEEVRRQQVIDEVLRILEAM